MKPTKRWKNWLYLLQNVKNKDYMKKNIVFIVAMTILFSCETPIIEKVDTKHPSNTPKRVLYYQEIDGKEVLIEEKQYYDNQQFKMGGKFLNEKREGKWEAYFEDGQVQSIGEFKDGKRTGEAKVYFPNGQLRYEGQYEKDKEIGHWKFYNEQGKLVTEKDF